MASNVIMPQLGESVVEGTISRWLVKEGDSVEKYAPIVEISTDKVDTEVPAPVSGVILRIVHPEGTTVRAGAAIAVIGQPGEAVPGLVAEAETRPVVVMPSQGVVAAPPPAESGTEPRDLGRISPVVGRIAREHAVDLTQVTGSGLDGRITKKDILAYVEARDQVAAETPTVVAPTAPRVTTPAIQSVAEAALPSTPAAAPAGADEELVPHLSLIHI